MTVHALLSLIKLETFSEYYFLLRTEVPEESTAESIISQATLSADLPYFGSDPIIRQLRTDGLVIHDYRLQLWEDSVLKIAAKEDCIVINFLLKGEKEDHVQTNEISGCAYGRHNLQYGANFVEEYLLRKNCEYDSFCIFMSKDFYFRLIGKTNSLCNEFAQQVRDGISVSLSPNYLPMNFEMDNIIHKLRSCTRKGSFHRLCLEIKLQELLLLQFEQYHDMVEKSLPRQVLHEEDEKKIRVAQTILEEFCNTPPTIRELARMVGVNEFKLKKGFKALVQCTIHDYVLKYRMEKANQMIRKQNMQMRDVAIELGYKNPSHFSAAFKKHFGFLPTEMIG